MTWRPRPERQNPHDDLPGRPPGGRRLPAAEQYWSVASWYADGQSGHSFFSTLLNVNVGDVLTPVMTLTGKRRVCSSSCDFDGIANATLPITKVEELTWCIETLDAYGVTGPPGPPTTRPPQHPNDHHQPHHRPHQSGHHLGATHAVTDTGQHTIVVDNSFTSGEVDICSQASAPDHFGRAWPRRGVPLVRSGDHLEVFLTDANGHVLSAAWEPDFADGWHGWWQINEAWRPPVFQSMASRGAVVVACPEVDLAATRG